MFASSRTRLAILIASLALLTALSVQLHAQAQRPTFKPHQQVEAREGDVWSPAVIVSTEGRRYQIRYGDGTTEWVTADRLREPQANGSGPTASAAENDADTTPAKPRFRTREQVEIKWGGSWRKGSVKQVERDLYLVAYDGWDKQFHWEWVTPDRVRKPGSDEEGPSHSDQFGQRVGSGSIPASLAEARKKLKARGEKPADTPGDKPGGADKASPFAPPPLDAPVTEPDRSAMQMIQPKATAGNWTAKPDPADTQTRFTTRNIPLSSATEPGCRVVASAITGSTALVCVQKGSPASPSDLQAELLDLRTGRSVAALEVNVATLPLAVSPSGELFAARSNGFHSGSKTRLDLWKRQGKALEHVISFEPVKGDNKAWRDIEWIEFLDDTRALVGTASSISCWELASAKAIWAIGMSHLNAATLSPGRKYLALTRDAHLLMLESTTGKVVGSLAGAPEFTRSLAFSPDGERIAAFGGNVLHIWDLQQGRKLPSIGVPADLPGLALIYLDPENLLVDTTLVNLKLSAPVWKYELSGSPLGSTPGGRVWLVVRDRTRQALASCQLPDAPSKTALSKMKPAESVLRPGMSVSLDLGGMEGDAALRDEVASALTQQLARRQIKVADAQPIRIVARTETGASEQRTYQTIGGGPGRGQQTVTVTEKITRLTVEADGKPAWEIKNASTAGSFVQIQENQSLDQAVQASQAPSAAFLRGVTLPDIIAPPVDPLPTSKPLRPSSTG